VASYNIQHGADSSGEFNLAHTARTIRRTAADVVGLEEVDKHWSSRSKWQDEPARLAHMLHMHVYFAHIYDFAPPSPGAPRREYGLAILSRYPIKEAENHSITRLSTQTGSPKPKPAPGFPEVVVDIDGTPVHIYATHLDFRGDPSVRETQVSETLKILAEDGDHARQVLMGDFNAQPGAPELAPLWGRLTDMWAAAGYGSGFTFPANSPEKRIDYVAASGNIAKSGVRTRVPETQTSDHRPVVAQLSVTQGRNDGN
jgi:endonuclease/exonuclease/phosphatase family metal-dependent hydrolase